MRRGIVTWITMTLLLAGLWLMLTSLPGDGRGVNFYREALGMSLLIVGMILAFRRLWPRPGQVDRASLVFMVVSTLPSWLVASGARWRIKWRLVAHIAWGTLLLLALAAVVAALLGDSGDAIFLETVVMALNVLGNLIVMMARLPASRRQA